MRTAESPPLVISFAGPSGKYGVQEAKGRLNFQVRTR